MVVFPVADPDDIQRRQFQSGERRDKAARFVDAGREHHHRPLVEHTICSSSPRSRIASRTIFSLGSHVATMLRPTESGLTLRRRSASTKAGGGASPSRISCPVAGSTSTAPFSTTARSKRSSYEKTCFRSVSSRPVTRISLRPDCFNEEGRAPGVTEYKSPTRIVRWLPLSTAGLYRLAGSTCPRPASLCSVGITGSKV
jgi:hypothetical protein